MTVSPVKKMKLKSRNFNNIFNVTVLILTALLTGCSSDSSTILGEDSHFLLVRIKPGDTYKSLAEQYYGTPSLAEKIRSLNPELKAKGGDIIAIPKNNTNPAGVYPDGYRTIPILCYHRFTRQQHSDERLNLPEDMLRQQLRYLTDNNYQVIALNELDAYLGGEKEIPEKSVVITIDDGYRSVYEIAYPLFKKFNTPATLFVYTDFIGAPMAINWKQTKEMSASGLIDIQSHSKSHASLVTPEKPESEAEFIQRIKREIQYPKAILERKLNKKIDLFSYPYGDSSDDAIYLLKERKIRMAVTVQHGGNPSFSNPLLLHRAMVYADDTIESFRNKLTTFHQERF